MRFSSFFLSVFIVVVSKCPKSVPQTTVSGTTPNGFPGFPCINSLFLHLKCRTTGCIHLPLAVKPWSSSSALCLFLLAGDVSPNPGPKDNVTLAFTNIRSIQNKHPSVLNYVQATDVDVFGITETWLSDDVTTSFISEITPPGYTFHHKSRLNRKGGGVGIFIQSRFDCCTVTTPVFSSFEHITVSCKLGLKHINLVCIYRPPGSSKEFLDDFPQLLEYLQSLPSDPVIFGDLNLDPIKHNSPHTKYIDLLSGFNLVQHVKVLTHIHGGILDHFITPDSMPIHKVVINDCLSDHMVIKVSLPIYSEKVILSNLIKVRQFNKINKTSLEHDLLNSDLITNPNNSSCQNIYHQYETTLNNLLDKHAPLKEKKLNRQTAKWITPEFMEAKRKKRFLEKKWRRTKSLEDRSVFRRQVNLCNGLLYQAKCKFYTDLINDNQTDPKALWKQLNTVLHRTPVSVLPKDVSSASLANRFSTFFIDKIRNIHAGFPSLLPSAVLHRDIPTFSEFHSVSTDDVRNIIMSSPTKSCTLDPWPTFLVKEYIDILIQPITTIVNLSLSEGVVIDKFKSAVVTPLIKKPSLDPDVLKNYRPVSGLNFISKTIERVVSKQLKHHLTTHELDNINQSAYKSGHSTETALLKITADVKLNLAQNIPTGLVLLDLSAAFDTIDHQQLSDELSSKYGLSGCVHNWFCSYISNRSQSVKIQDSLSQPESLAFGVPQGSVLGPLLFTMYTTALSSVIDKFQNIKHHLYADDTQIYIAITPVNQSSAVPELQECLRSVQEWMALSKLKLNPDKTEFIVFGTPAQQESLKHIYPIDILGNLLHPSNCVRNLGVLFDSGLSFSKQIGAIRKSCYYHMRDFARIRRFLPKSVSITVANALVSSRVDYCNSLLKGCYDYDLRRLQGIQNSLCRIITRTSRFSSITPHLIDLHWLPVRQRIDFKWCLLIFKCLQTGIPPYLHSGLTAYSCVQNTRRSSPSNNYLTRSVSFDRTVHKSKRFFDSSFTVGAPLLWNSLPLCARTATSLSSFRRHLKTHLFSIAYPGHTP